MNLFKKIKKNYDTRLKRKVFIIKGYSKSENEDLCDKHYCEKYFDFFNSNAGGAYEKNEIVFLDQPNFNYLNKMLNKEFLEFGILVFVGHGGNQNNNQIFQLNENEIIKAGQYLINTKKQIIVLESCRLLMNSVPTVDLEDKIPAFEKGGILRDKLTRVQSREIYDSHIKRCEEGTTICYACQLGKSAYNYFFSYSFLQNAMDWHLDSSRHCSVLPIDELMRLTSCETALISALNVNEVQDPYDENPMNFPIALSKY